VRSRKTREPMAPFNGTSPEMAALGKFFREQGLYTLVRWNYFFTNPPLTISDEELEEGFAIYLAGEGEMFSRYLRRGILTTDELEKRLQHPETQTEMRSLYADAYAKIVGMVRAEGEASVWKRLAAN